MLHTGIVVQPIVAVNHVSLLSLLPALFLACKHGICSGWCVWVTMRKQRQGDSNLPVNYHKWF
jgi:hypothetical protein